MYFLLNFSVATHILYRAFHGKPYIKNLVVPLVLPGKLAKHGSHNVLQLPRDYHHREIFLEAARKIEALRLPEPAEGEKFGFVSNRR